MHQVSRSWFCEKFNKWLLDDLKLYTFFITRRIIATRPGALLLYAIEIHISDGIL